MNRLFFKNNISLTIVSFFIFLKFSTLRIVETKTVLAATREDTLVPFLEPKFISPVQNQTAAVGREVIFSCSVSNIGKYKVGWLRASDKMIISFHTRAVIENDRFAVKYESANTNKASSDHRNSQGFDIVNGTWHLIIRQIKESDQGCYMCQINTSPMISELGCLDVQVSPDILNNETSTDISVNEDGNATLRCKAIGRPTPKISWKREDGQPILIRPILYNGTDYLPVNVYNDSVLNLYRINRKQMGNYLCIASNEVHPAVSKRVTLSVNFPPNVQALNQLLGSPLGTDVELECKVEAHPSTVNYWFKDSNQENMLPEGSKYSIKETRDGYKVFMRLTIKQFNDSDVGSYSCISSNSLGKVEGTCRLYKIGDFKSHGLVHESNHISILAGLAEAARGNGLRSNAHVNAKFSCCRFYFIVLISLLNILLER